MMRAGRELVYGPSMSKSVAVLHSIIFWKRSPRPIAFGGWWPDCAASWHPEAITISGRRATIVSTSASARPTGIIHGDPAFSRRCAGAIGGFGDFPLPIYSGNQLLGRPMGV
jgi:hypothetical protein